MSEPPVDATMRQKAARAMAGMAAILQRTNGKKGARGIVDCECGGERTLHFATDKGNGHVRAECTSCGLQFMS